MTAVDYKDTHLLRTFISDRGKIRSRRVTGLSPQQQRQVEYIERRLKEDGRDIRSASLQEMEQFYQEGKRQEKEAQ